MSLMEPASGRRLNSSSHYFRKKIMTDESSLAGLKNNSEHSRAELAATILQLRSQADETVSEIKEKVSISHIKHEIKSYVSDTSGSLLANLKARAKENPLQAVAAGVAVAYPLFGLLRRVPVPLMLIGGGFWLAQHNRQGSVETELTQNAANQVNEIKTYITDRTAAGYRRATDSISGMSTSVSDVAGDIAESVSQAADIATKTVTDATKTATAPVRDLAKQVGKLADDVGLSAQTLGQKITAGAEEYANAAGQIASAGARKLGSSDILSDPVANGRKAKNALIDFVERNSLLVAGASLVMGALVAASVPSTEVEDRLTGKGSDFLKNRMRETAADGVDQATRFAAGIVGDAVASAAQQGFNSETVSRAVDSITAGIKSIATKGAEAALGDPAHTQAPSLPQIQ